jgi:hypothetical protein
MALVIAGNAPRETGQDGQVIALDSDGNPDWAGLPLIPPIADLFPTTRRWRKVKPCGTAAAWRRHQRRKTPICDKCRAWRKRWDGTRKGR